jgi:hypothetical protein
MRQLGACVEGRKMAPSGSIFYIFRRHLIREFTRRKLVLKWIHLICLTETAS